MALTTDDLKAHLNVIGDEDNALIARVLDAAKAHVVRLLGFALDDPTEFPDGTPADLEQAVLMLAAGWYENRESTITGTIVAEMPFGVADVIREHRRYSFG